MVDDRNRIIMIAWVYAQDLEATCRFYAGTLGLPLMRDEGEARLYGVTDTSSIGVCRAFGDRVVEPAGGMISIVTDDVDAWYDRLSAAGTTLRGAPERLDQFGIYTFFAEDPNGYVIEFQQFL